MTSGTVPGVVISAIRAKRFARATTASGGHLNFESPPKTRFGDRARKGGVDRPHTGWQTVIDGLFQGTREGRTATGRWSVGRVAILAAESCCSGLAPLSGDRLGLSCLMEGNAFHVDPRRATHRPKLNGESATVLQLFPPRVVTELKDARLDVAAPVEERAR
jgi:hypothetical protein